MRSLLLPLVLLAGPAHAQDKGEKGKPAAPRPLRVTWGKILEKTPSCFYFSGPHGRDIQLVGSARVSQSGTEVAIAFDQVTFRGTLTDGGFEVTRHGTHEFNGTWTVDERIRGKFVDGGVVGRYHYEECETGATCPSTCIVDAELALRR